MTQLRVLSLHYFPGRTVDNESMSDALALDFFYWQNFKSAIAEVFSNKG